MLLGKNALKVLERRYLTRDENNEVVEDVEGLFRRVADHIAKADAVYDKNADTGALAQEFYDVMTTLRFMPNSPTLMNAGKPLGQLSACFVLPVGDSMEEIFDSVKYAALIHKSGGGTGFSFSRLRPAGDTVRSTGGVASGPISFMRVFNAATEAVKQGGTRRGANMGILRVDHPDIMSFIDCKKKNTDITNFNISVGITDAFMTALAADADYDLIDPRNNAVKGRKSAKAVFDKIVDAAWRNGEPGIVFLDRLNRDNPTPNLGAFESTNPCGEQPLLPYESCNLGSINLSAMVKSGEDGLEPDYELLGATVDTAVHFLDNVVEVNRYPLPDIDKVTRSTRKVGLGVMGWADMLFRLGIPYNSQEAVNLGGEIMRFIQYRAREYSIELAKTRGVYPAFKGSVHEKKNIAVRNATTTTIAPTGTISIICGVSSGVEPLFALSFVRNVMDNDELPEVNPYFEAEAKRRGFYTPELMRRIAKQGTLAHIDEIPEDVKRVFVTAHDIAPEDHIAMQAAFQRFTDNAVSKTVNFANSATREDVRNVYILAYKSGCKGVTIYRDGSRDEQVLYVGDKVKKDEAQAAQEAESSLKIQPRPRPTVTHGHTEKVQIGCGNLYVTVNYDDKGICEVFTNLGRAGGCPSQSEATSRLISVALRSGMDVDSIIEQLKGIRCHSTLRQMSQRNIKVLSCPDAIARVIAKVAKEHSLTGFQSEPAKPPVTAETDVFRAPTNGDFVVTDIKDEEIPESAPCPECGAHMEHESGCVICRACGYSKCG